MGVSAHEKTGRTDEQPLADGGIVTAGITTDVLDEDIRSLDGEAVQFRIEAAHITSVDVSVDGMQRTESSQTFRHFLRADVAGMPNFIALVEMLQVAVVPIAVGVGEDADSCHANPNLCFTNWRMYSTVLSMPITDESTHKW